MGPPLCMWSAVDQNVIMQCMTAVLANQDKTIWLANQLPSLSYYCAVWSQLSQTLSISKTDCYINCTQVCFVIIKIQFLALWDHFTFSLLAFTSNCIKSGLQRM